MSKRIVALWHTNLNKLEHNQKVLNYCSCNKYKKARQHLVQDFKHKFIFLKCCNCGEETVMVNRGDTIERYGRTITFNANYYFDEILQIYLSKSMQKILEYKEIILKSKT